MRPGAGSVGPLLWVLLTAAGCGQPGVPAAVDWARAARAAHLRADAALARGDLDGARAAMLEIADGATPEDVLPLDARVLRQDACYRLAELALASGQPAEALARAERGLALGDELDVFSANLHIARGRALEGLARPVEAAAAYHRALVVHEALLAEALSEGGAS